MLDLKNLEVVEMNSQEIISTEGGGEFGGIARIIIAILSAINRGIYGRS